MSKRELRSLLMATFREWRRDHPALLAGGLSFFTLLSLSPLIVSLLTVFGQFVDIGDVLSRLDDIFGAPAGQFIGEWILSTKRHHGLHVFGITLLLYATSRTFRHLQTSLNIIWKIPEERWRYGRHYVRRVIVSVFMVIASWLLFLTLALLNSGVHFASHLIGYWLPLFVTRPIGKSLGVVISFGVSILVFAAINKWIPSISIRWKDTWPGAILTAILFALGKIGLNLYFGGRTLKALYGTAGSVIIVMIWVYVSAQIFFFGAVFTKLYTEQQHGDRRRV